MQVPRLCVLGLRDVDDPLPFALALIRSWEAEGVSAAVCLIGSDREAPGHRGQARLVEASGHAVHRIDVDLMPVPSIQRVVERAGSEVDVVLVIGFEPVAARALRMPAFVDVQHALEAPLVLCADALDRPGARPPSTIASAVQEAIALLAGRGLLEAPILLLRDEVGGQRADSVGEAIGITALALNPPPSDAHAEEQGQGAEQTWRARADVLGRVLDHGRLRASEPQVLVPRPDTSGGDGPGSWRARRARIGVALDECFDLYDEESLLAFELAGAELTPVSPLRGEADLLDGLDGLIVGDGRIESHSVGLSRARAFRERLASMIEDGLPTLASGGGYAYLTRGLRTLSGALHPFVGIIDAEAVQLTARPPFGHVEVETLVDTLIGAPGQRLRGFVQRSWLVRGLDPAERGIYATVSGPRDEGCGRQDLFATHFRPYWPSCPGAAEGFVERCVRVAVARERIALRQGDGSSEA